MLEQRRGKIDGRVLKRKCPKEYRQEFEQIVQGKFELLSEYEKAAQRVKIRHVECGTEFEVSPTIFIKRPVCRACHDKNKRLNPEEYKARFERNFKGVFELATVYTRHKDPLQIRHTECGTVFKIMPLQVMTNLQCPACKRPEVTETFFMEKLKNDMYRDYEISYEEYAENKPVRIKHKECGERFEEYPGVFLKEPSCPACEKDYIDDQSFKKKIEERYQGRFKVLNRFRGYQYPICVQHTDPNCLKYSYPYATNFSNGKYRCPHCEAKGCIKNAIVTKEERV